MRSWNSCQIVIDYNYTTKIVAEALRFLAAKIEPAEIGNGVTLTLPIQNGEVVGVAIFSRDDSVIVGGPA
jgi:hypothetical protein